MSLPGWLEPLPDSAQQRALDTWAIEQVGIPGIDLMELAGSGLADIAGGLVPAGPIAVVCGKGNNGGDGLVAARVLRQRGREVRVLLLGDPGELRGDAKTNLDRLPGDGPEPFSEATLRHAAGIIDAILGTGFEGEPREPAAGAIKAINAASEEGTIVIACDVPSGVDASSGEALGAAVRANATATFNAAKPGLWISPGKTLSGEVVEIEIGIPPGGPAEPTAGLILPSVLDEIPRRGRESTKFAAGSVLVCGGSTGLTGAPSMASEAAMRTGAGYVTALVPASLNLVFEMRLLEVMSVPLPDSDGALQLSAADTVLERCERADALILGPGIGRADATIELVREIARRAPVPLLLDADGLFAHAGRLDALASREAPTVLTPHAGELGRLLEEDSAEIGAHRLRSALKAAKTANAIVVLKGDDTLVATPRGEVAISTGGAAALATAGTGDVLSGVIGALLAKKMDPWHAAGAGVFAHASAGRLAAEEIGDEGVIARDVIARLPAALAGDGPD
jgi:ADP-dependent NAD(P)H-hydrate dehydratase / NAD(P)H-hydrate epimerase